MSYLRFREESFTYNLEKPQVLAPAAPHDLNKNIKEILYLLKYLEVMPTNNVVNAFCTYSNLREYRLLLDFERYLKLLHVLESLV